MEFRLAMSAYMSSVFEKTACTGPNVWIVLELSGPERKYLQLNLTNQCVDDTKLLAPDVLVCNISMIALRADCQKKHPCKDQFEMLSTPPQMVVPEGRFAPAEGSVLLFHDKECLKLDGNLTLLPPVSNLEPLSFCSKAQRTKPISFNLTGRQREWANQVSPWAER